MIARTRLLQDSSVEIETLIAVNMEFQLVSFLYFTVYIVFLGSVSKEVSTSRKFTKPKAFDPPNYQKT